MIFRFLPRFKMVLVMLTLISSMIFSVVMLFYPQLMTRAIDYIEEHYGVFDGFDETQYGYDQYDREEYDVDDSEYAYDDYDNDYDYDLSR